MSGYGYTCPYCGSGNTTTWEMAYRCGTGDGSATSFGVNGGGLSSARARGSYQTDLAAYCRPPKRGCMDVLVCGSLFGFVGPFCFLAYFGSGISIIFIVLFIITCLLVWLLRYLDKKYQKEMDDWRRGCICLRCGHTWYRNY